MPSLPPLNALHAFDVVGRHGSVAAAAAELGVSPGAVSQQVHKLEAHLGVTLLERNGRKLELTRWGRLYHARVRKGFESFARAGEELENARDNTGLTLSALTSVINKWIGRKIFDWQKLYPQTTVHLVGTEVEPDMAGGDVDFRIYYGTRAHHPHHVELFTDWVVPACSPGLLKARQPAAMEDILTFPLLHVVWNAAFNPAPSWSDWAASIGADYDTGTRAGLTYTLSSSAIDAAVSGRGFVLAQMAMISDELQSGRLVVPFDHRVRLAEPYFLTWSRASLQKPYAGEFRRWLIGCGREQAAISAPAPKKTGLP